MKYPKLFSPIKINQMMVRNRIVATPIGDEFYEKAIGGAGIVICGHTIVDPGRSSFASPDEPYVFHKYAVEEAQSRIRKCHSGGAKASLELFHAGQYARVKDYALGPMGFVRDDGVEVRAMDEKAMEEVAQCFAQAALDAKQLGYDMVFMHYGHGWLPAQFLSPLFNHRQDAYGGSFENRAKFPLLILQRVREAVGPYYPVDMRISAVEWVEGSIEFEDTLAFVKLAEAYIDTVQISAGLDINHEGNVHMVTTNFKGHMVNREFARQVKAAVSIPVSSVGANMGPVEGEELLTAGDVDLVAYGRSFIADPDWPNKALAGKDEDIVPCIRCNQCYHISTNRRNVGCSVNPRYQNESYIAKELRPIERQKRVVVVGAGVAGIKAALTASSRGHHVILIEKTDYLGGAIHHVAKEHFKEDIRRYLVYLKGQLAKSKVEVHLNTLADQTLIERLQADTLILAVGAEPVVPKIPGSEQTHVMGFYDAIEKEAELKGEIVVIGGGTIGAEIALELAEVRQQKVTIVEMGDTIAAQGNLLYRIALRQKMEVLPQLTVHLKSQCEQIDEDTVMIRQADGSQQRIPADHVVIAIGVRANQQGANSLFNQIPETYMVGDCQQPRKIMEAVFEGYTIGNLV